MWHPCGSCTPALLPLPLTAVSLLGDHYLWSQRSSQAQIKAKRQCPLHVFSTPPRLYRPHHTIHVFPHALLSLVTPSLTPSLCLQSSPSPFQVPQATPTTTYPTFMWVLLQSGFPSRTGQKVCYLHQDRLAGQEFPKQQVEGTQCSSWQERGHVRSFMKLF